MPANRLDSHLLRQRWPLLILIFLQLTLSFRIDGGDLNPVLQSGPPQFLSIDAAGVQPTQIWLDERERLNLKCPLKTNATYIQWIKDGQQLQDETAMFLDMPAVSRIDSGVYQCYAENAYGALYSWPINVTIMYLDGFQTDTLSVVIVPELGNFVLKPPAVRASIGVQLSWRWFYQDSEITSDHHYYITLNGQLVVGSPSLIHGNYSVQVKASNGPSFYHHFLVESDGDPRRIADFKMLLVPEDRVYIHGRAAPFSLTSGDRSSPAGTPTFECVPSTVSKNPATIRWFLNNEALVSGGQDGVRIEQRGRRLILGAPHDHFQNDVHMTTVSCRAATAFDEIAASAKLSMIVVPKIDRRFMDGERPVPLGSALRLKCKCTDAWPRAKISWYFNGKKIPNTLSSDILKIDSVENQNYGVYQCEATNKAGSDIASVWVRKSEKKDQDEELFSPLGDSPSTSSFQLVDHFSDKTLKIGTDLQLQCLTSDPVNTQLTWKLNGKELKVGDKFQMNKTSLVIRGVDAKDSGRYECVATNLETEESVKASADIQVRGSNLIEYGPTNQSVLIGTNIKMPCKIADDVLVRHGQLKPEWSRNGQKISPDGDLPRRLAIDPDGSLSITQVGPDSIGTYKCLVKLGDEMEALEASLQIIERPAMPQNVEAFVNTTMNPARIRVSWKSGFDGNSPLINHLVEMRTLAGPNNELASEWTTVVKDIPPELCCSILVDNLKPSASAEFRVIAVNRFGQGRPSVPSPNITMPQQPPAAAPRDVKGSGRSSSSIIVQWQPPKPDEWNGDILGYTVRYRLAGYPTLPWMEKNISLTAHSGPPNLPSAKNVLIDQLISWRDYEIQVAAFNDLGAGVYSKSIEVAPLESAPMQAVQNVDVEVLNSTDIRVSFDPLDQQLVPGVNLGYKIELWKGAAGTRLYKLVRVFPDYSRLTQQISGLEKWGKYNLTVLCFTAPGDGPRSEALEFQTEEDVPGPVASINFDQVLYSSVLVQWDAPADSNGHIIKYILRHWETSQSMDKNVIEVGGHELNATIEGLRASTQYSVDLQALTQVGAGPRVEAKFESGIPPELPGRASSVVVSDINARSAVLQFIPGFDGHSYIKNWIVEAKIGSSTVFSTLFTVSAPKARSITVERLRPNTKYQLRLIAENVRGKGPPSEPTRAFETRQTEPERAPEKLYAEPLSDERIQVVWSPLSIHDWNGDPIGYLVTYRPVVAKRLGGRSGELMNSDEAEMMDQRDWKEVRTSSPKASELTLLGLEPYTTYQVKIYAENTFGRSAASDLVSATTYESVPAEGPPNVQVQLEQQSIRVQWDDLSTKHKHGQILGFRVRCEPEDETLKKRYSQVADMVGADVRIAHFSNLRPFTDYRCFVHARTIVGESPASKEAPLIRTSESRPSVPTNVRFSRISNNSVNLLWSHPAQPNGQIIGFEIRYKKQDQPETTAITTAVRSTLNEFSANSLTPNTTYLFSIRAETQSGWGPEANAPVFTNSQRAPNPSPPPAPTANPKHAPSAKTVFLHWPATRQPHEPLTSRVAPVRSIEIEFQRANEIGWTMLDYSVGAEINEVQLDGLIPNQPYRARIRYITDFDRTSWSPESEWIKTLEMEPESAPQNLEARPYESSSILLEWQALDPLKWNSDRVGYRVLYRIYQSNYSFLVDELPLSDQKPEGGKVQHVIKKLASFHHYIVQVQTYNSLGSSTASTPPAFVYVGYSIPKQEVHGLEIVNSTSTSIHLKWDDWQASEDDVISGYRIRYTPLLSSLADEFKMDDAGESLEETVVTEKNEVNLVDLRKFTEYQISVCGYNRAGDGHAASTRAWTLEDVPGPVGSLQFSDILLDSVNVSWPEPAQPNGKIIGYSITYRTYRQPDERRKEIQEKSSTNWLLASRLDEQTTYSFSVQALTAAGPGTEVASNVTIGYNEGAPEAPTKPLILPEETTFVMRWQNGLPGRSPIKGHLIQAKRIGVVTDQNKTLLIDDDESFEDVKMMDTSANPMDKKPPKLITSRRLRRHVSQAYADAYSPRHQIGEWFTLTHLIGGHQSEYRISYRQLEPASFYIFRVYARNDMGVGRPSVESDKLQVPSTLPDDPFYTKWWFLVIVGLLILMVIIVFVATLCVTSANAWKKEHEKQSKQGAYDTHQLPDDFVVSYELQSKRDRVDDQNTTPRPGTHTSWLSNEGLANGRLNTRSGDGDPAYGSIGSGLNGQLNTGRSIYGSSSVYQALATDQLPVDGSRKPTGAFSGYASRKQVQPNGNQSRSTNYWTQRNDDGDYVTYGQHAPDMMHEDQVDAAEQAERSFASHYQASNPLQEDAAYRTWRRNRHEQAERARTPSRHAASNFGGYASMGLQVGQQQAGSRPESVSTSDSPGNGSEIGAAGSASTQSAKSVNLAQSAGIQLRGSDEFDSPPKHVPYASVAHGYSSFV